MNRQKEEFMEFFKSLNNNFGDLPYPDNWYEKCIESHKDIVQKIGGVRHIIEISGDDNISEKNIVVEDKRATKLIDEVSKMLGPLGYFDCYRLHPGMLAYTRIPHGFGMLKRQEGMSWGKHISGWIKRNGSSIPNKPQLIQDVNNILGQLGQLWTEAENKKNTFYVNITTNPKAFVTLGHYKADGNSCFGNGGFNRTHKFALGQTKNTFIGIVTKNPNGSETWGSADPMQIGRFWGWADDDFSTWTIGNLYPRYDGESSLFFKLIKKTFDSIIGQDCTTTKDICMVVGGIYFNSENRITFHKKDQPLSKFQILHSEINDILKYQKCANCVLQGDEQTLCIDGRFYCRKCYSKQKVYRCEYIKEFSFYPLVDGVLRDGASIQISSNTRDRCFFQCGYSKKYYEIFERGRDVSGLSIANSHAKSLGMKYCKNCYLWNNANVDMCLNCCRSINE